MKEFDKQRPVQEAVSDGVIEGRNAVIERCAPGPPSTRSIWPGGRTDAALGHIASTARSKGVVWWSAIGASWTA